MEEVTLPLAFAAGILSFLSPCVLPLVPSYLTFITGVSFEELSGDVTPERKKHVMYLTLTNSLIFIMGFSTVFIALGASSSLLGDVLYKFQDWLRVGGGILVIIFGLFISGIIKMDFLMAEKKFHFQGKPAGYIGTYLIGMAFAAGWTPCIGPILGSILLVASTEGSVIHGVRLLAVYSMGLGLPLLIAAFFFNTFLSYSRMLNKHMKIIMMISGLILIAFGLILLTDKVTWLSGLLPDFGINF